MLFSFSVLKVYYRLNMIHLHALHPSRFMYFNPSKGSIVVSVLVKRECENIKTR